MKKAKSDRSQKLIKPIKSLFSFNKNLKSWDSEGDGTVESTESNSQVKSFNRSHKDFWT